MNKKLEKAYKSLGKDTVTELEAMSPQQLKNRITQANDAMRDAEESLEANANYQKLKGDLAALTQGKSAVNKRQKAVIRVCLALVNKE